MALPTVISREYKFMLDHRLFVNSDTAVPSFDADLQACVNRLKDIGCVNSFNKQRNREIIFLDTPDQTIALNGYILRLRRDLDKDRTELTLKCRSPDRYVAAGSDVSSASGEAEGEKFEEDIGAPFVCRFSNSNTIKIRKETPATIADAATWFPVLSKLQRDGEICRGTVELRAVNSITVFERVFKGPTLKFADTTADVALILWSDGAQGRPLVAEFSFRYAHDQEDYSSQIAQLAMTCFQELQRLDWCLPGGGTKTQFMYRD